MIEPGRMRHRVRIERAAAAGAGRFGQQIAGTYQAVAEVWAAVTSALGGRELLEAQQLDVRVTHKVTIRWRPGVSLGDRIVMLRDGRELEIVTIADPDERHRWLELLCSEAAETT